jgi:hypothetical protein
MSYLTQGEIAANPSMAVRVAQCYATETTDPPVDPDGWTFTHRRDWAASPGWDAKWESAKVTHPEPEYDPGADESVITDADILATVQPMIASS